MRTTKQLSTMAVVALAGASLGVMPTFGWWQETQAKPAESAVEVAPGAKKPGQAATEESTQILTGAVDFVQVPDKSGEPNKQLPKDVVIKTLTETVGSDKSGPIPARVEVDGQVVLETSPVFKAVVASPPHYAHLEKMIEKLRAEGKELAARGQKELAAAQFRIADQLQEALKQKPTAIEITTATPGKPYIKMIEVAKHDQALIEHQKLLEKLTDHAANLKRKLAETKGDEHAKVEAEMQETLAHLAKIQAVIAQRANLKMWSSIEHKTKGGNKEPDQQAIQPDVRKHLHHLAEQLERSGQKDAARSLRETAGKLHANGMQDVRGAVVFKEPGGDHSLQHVIIVNADESGRVSVKGTTGANYLVIEDGKGPKKVADAVEPAPAPMKKPLKQKVVKHDGDKEVSNAELKKVLMLMRNEISELRQEVEALRGDLMHADEDDDKKQDDDKGDDEKVSRKSVVEDRESAAKKEPKDKPKKSETDDEKEDDDNDRPLSDDAAPRSEED